MAKGARILGGQALIGQRLSVLVKYLLFGGESRKQEQEQGTIKEGRNKCW